MSQSNQIIGRTPVSTATAAHLTALNTGLPGVRWIQKAIREQMAVAIVVTSQEVLQGTIRWQDPECLCLRDANSLEWIIWRSAIIYIRPQQKEA
jgi:host factor-I protein